MLVANYGPSWFFLQPRQSIPRQADSVKYNTRKNTNLEHFSDESHLHVTASLDAKMSRPDALCSSRRTKMLTSPFRLLIMLFGRTAQIWQCKLRDSCEMWSNPGLSSRTTFPCEQRKHSGPADQHTHDHKRSGTVKRLVAHERHRAARSVCGRRNLRGLSQANSRDAGYYGDVARFGIGKIGQFRCQWVLFIKNGAIQLSNYSNSRWDFIFSHRWQSNRNDCHR